MLNGDGNENNWSKKQKKKKTKRNNYARAAHFSVHCAAVVVAQLQL